MSVFGDSVFRSVFWSVFVCEVWPLAFDRSLDLLLVVRFGVLIAMGRVPSIVSW